MPSKIEWTDESWNPITGCTPISEGCRNCYAQRMAKRLAGRYGYPADEPFTPGNWRGSRINKKTGDMIISDPRYWKKPRKVFVCSMGDLFHDAVHRDSILRVFLSIFQHPKHQFLILTKRPDRMRSLVSAWLQPALRLATYLKVEIPWPLPNVWLGVTAENQEQADKRIPVLLDTQAAVRFVSVEPMLGPIDMRFTRENYSHCASYSVPGEHLGLDWVICGGETGPGARPMNVEWVLDLQEQCKSVGIPFFFKKWGVRDKSGHPYNADGYIDGVLCRDWPGAI